MLAAKIRMPVLDYAKIHDESDCLSLCSYLSVAHFLNVLSHSIYTNSFRSFWSVSFEELPNQTFAKRLVICNVWLSYTGSIKTFIEGSISSFHLILLRFFEYEKIVFISLPIMYIIVMCPFGFYLRYILSEFMVLFFKFTRLSNGPWF